MNLLKPVALCFLFLCCSLLQAQTDVGLTYDLNIESLTSIAVTIHLPSTPSSLYESTAASGKDDGFASYVRDLTVQTAGITEQPVRSGATWKIEHNGLTPCVVRYKVDLSFAKVRWEVGNEQAAFNDGSGTFVVSKALFLESDLPGTRKVSFRLPAGWALVTPWEQKQPGMFQFQRDEVLQDLLAFGKLAVASTTSSGLQVKLVTFGDLKKQQSSVFEMVDRVSADYNRIFPGTLASAFMIVLIPGKEADGEAYANGFASTVESPLKPNAKIIWGNVIAHEMFHHWNGQQIRAKEQDADLEWLSEGFTEYFANMALIRTREIAPTEFLQKVATNVGQYEYFLNSGLFNDITLATAGTKKGRYRFGVYAGGWVIAFVLDQEIRKTSHGTKTLADLMRYLLAQPSHERLTLAAFLDAVEAVSGAQVRKLIDHAITSRDSVDPEKYLETIGFDVVGQSYADEYYIHVNPAATRGQLKARTDWAGF